MLSSGRLKHCYNVEDFRALAKKRLPKMVFDYLDSGAEDEFTYHRNRQAFEKVQLLPRTLRDVSTVNLSTTVLGQQVDMPIIFAPTGMTRLFHYRGEKEVAPAASRAGIIYSLSSVASTSIEQFSKICPGPKWFQIYVWRDRGLVKEFIQRCRAENYHALCLTVDLPTSGNREKDYRHGMSIPPAIRARSVVEMLLHPRWLLHNLTSPKIELANVSQSAAAASANTSFLEYIATQFDPSVTWEDAAWMREQWDGPFLLKGIMHPEDAKQAVELGMDGIVLSNHGGRQLDQCPASFDMLPEIVQAVGARAEIILDSGIRRGTDVLKALSLGAKACMIGRPYLYALAAGGNAGVERLLTLLRAELQRDMALIGCSDVHKLGPDYLHKSV